MTDPALLAEYRATGAQIVVAGGGPTLDAARDELVRGLSGLLGAAPPVARSVSTDGAIVVGTPRTSTVIRSLPLAADLLGLGREGYVIRTTRIAGRRVTVIAGNDEVGALYGTFALLRRMQTHQPVRALRAEF